MARQIDHVVALESHKIVVAAESEDLIGTIGAVDVVRSIGASELGHDLMPLRSCRITG